MDCKELKAVMRKFDITYDIMAKVAGTSVTTFCYKINNGTFWQDEMNAIVKELRRHDGSIDMNIFLDKNLNDIQI